MRMRLQSRMDRVARRFQSCLARAIVRLNRVLMPVGPFSVCGMCPRSWSVMGSRRCVWIDVELLDSQTCRISKRLLGSTIVSCRVSRGTRKLETDLFTVFVRLILD